MGRHRNISRCPVPGTTSVGVNGEKCMYQNPGRVVTEAIPWLSVIPFVHEIKDIDVIPD